MVKVVNDMSDFMRKNGIVDGSCGMRSLMHIGLSRKAISVQSALVHPYACQSSPSTSG